MDKEQFLNMSVECFEEQIRLLERMEDNLVSLNEDEFHLAGNPERESELRQVLFSARKIIVELKQTNIEALKFAEELKKGESK